ncbi:MAG: YciI family protein [Alphaproteobacteria bacterium]
MLYVLLCFDRPGSDALRQSNRAAHLDYVAAHGDRVKFAGPFLGEDEKTSIGSMLVIEAASKAEAESWAALDPYARAGLFEDVEIHAWSWVVGAPDTD